MSASTTAAAATLPATTVRAAKRATYLAFGGSGLATATFASRIPQVRDHLHLNPSSLGLVLLAAAAGSITSLPLSGAMIARFGSRRIVASMAVLMALAETVIGVGYLLGLPVVVLGLFLFGLSNGAWDVSMNVHGAVVERLLARSIMSRFHAGWSLGTVAGAGIGALMIALGVPVTTHLVIVGLLTGASVVVGVRQFVTDDAAREEPAHDVGPAPSAFAAWREPRTLLIGILVLAFAFAEGTGNDWIGVAVIDGFHSPAVVGTLAFATFLAAMTAGRWFGPPLLDRFGRVKVIRSFAAVAVLGLLLFVLGPIAPLAFVGAALWGLGTSLGFPTGMSAGADDQARAASRVSTIASIGYFAFLGGPPLIGFIGDRHTVRHALVVVAVLLALAMLLASFLRPPPEPSR